jgi:hypothetical protein
MPDAPEPTERELLTRLIEAVEALPEKIGEQVGYKLRFEQRLQDDDDRSRRELQENRGSERRKRADYVDQAKQETESGRWLVAIVIAGCSLAVGITVLLIQIL